MEADAITLTQHYEHHDGYSQRGEKEASVVRELVTIITK